MNAPIPDGRYDAFIVDAQVRDTEMALSIVITTGAEKGSLIDVISSQTRDEIEIIGLPCSVVVADGVPDIVW